jgi:hypothetical protein
MCRFCAPQSDGYSVTAAEDKVLQLLALLEHPTALPGDLALRLAGQLLRLTQPKRLIRRCDAVTEPATGIKQALQEKLV